jgi:DNA-binding NarL/FixJ family response regulator
MNGFEFLEAYAQLSLPYKQDIVIVILTTSLHPQDVSRLNEFDIAGFINKPLTKEKVNDIIQRHFGQELPGR